MGRSSSLPEGSLLLSFDLVPSVLGVKSGDSSSKKKVEKD